MPIDINISSSPPIHLQFHYLKRLGLFNSLLKLLVQLLHSPLKPVIQLLHSELKPVVQLLHDERVLIIQK